MQYQLVTMASLTLLGVSLLAACGSAGVNGASGDEPRRRPEPAATAAAEQAREPAAEGLTGAWENGSCGERAYRRRIEFFADGRFTAVDEVAPCPPGARCVWSGIIRWLGTWSLEGRVITITVEPAEGDKLPEMVPESFEFTGDPPATLAERIGDLVCPYRRID